MKKISLARRNALLTSRDATGGALALALFAGIALLRFFAPDLFWQAAAPAFRAADGLAAGVHTVLAGFRTAAALVAQNDALSEQNLALASENQELTKKIALLSALSDGPSTPGIRAGVVARPPQSPYDTLVLAAGKQDGVALGMEAFAAGNVPIGFVSQVTGGFSRVTLFTAPGVETGGWVGPRDIALTLEGAGGGALRAAVARTAGIVAGDTVYAPGPGMLPIGSVVRVDSDQLSPSITLRILPAANLFSLAWVELRSTGVVPLLAATSTSP